MSQRTSILVILIISTLISSLASCDFKSSEETKKKAKEEEVTKQLLGFLKNELKDADSAQFKNVKFGKLKYSGGESYAICGEVNAKNSFGGYSGFEGFIVSYLATGAPDVALEELASQDNWLYDRWKEQRRQLGCVSK
jgi:hypothetical protein